MADIVQGEYPNDGGDWFEKIIKAAANLPLVNVNRSQFLRKELSPFYDSDKVDRIIKDGPRGIVDKNVIDKIAEGCVTYHTTAVCAVSALAGIPGGLAMLASIPADIVQFYGHVLCLTQKLLYLYGWPDLNDKDGNMTDETTQVLVVFLGVMMGAQGAEAVVKSLLNEFAKQVEKKLQKAALTKVGVYNVVKEVCKWIGVKLTKEGFSKGVGKVIPIIGAPISAGVTYFTFRPLSKKLKEELDSEWDKREI